MNLGGSLVENGIDCGNHASDMQASGQFQLKKGLSVVLHVCKEWDCVEKGRGDAL